MEKELERRKQREVKRTFHKLSPSITSTFAFQSCTTLFPNTGSTRNGKYKEEEERTTKLNYPKTTTWRRNPKNYPKNYSKLLPLLLWTSHGIYRRSRAPGSLYEDARQILVHGSTTLTRKRGKYRVSATVLGLSLIHI